VRKTKTEQRELLNQKEPRKRFWELIHYYDCIALVFHLFFT